MTADLPPLREDLRLFPGPRRENGEPTWTLQDPLRNRFFRMGWSEFEILSRWHWGGAGEVAEKIAAETLLTISPAEITQFKDYLLRESLLSPERAEVRQQLLQRLQATQPSFWQQLVKNYLFFRIPLFSPDRFLARTLPWVVRLIRPEMLLLFGILSLLGVFLAARQWDDFQNTFLYLSRWEGVAWFMVTLTVTKICHELGHAYAAKYYGVQVPVMGVAFLVMWPVLYTDMTEGWKLADRRARLMLASAGVMVELALAMVATLAWSFTPDGPLRSALFLQATTSWVATLVVNLSPFMRFDGYFLLSDLLDIPNLQERAFALGRWSMRRWLLGMNRPPPEYFTLSRQRLLIVYAWFTWAYRLVLFTAVALTVYHFFFKLLGLILFAVELGWFIIHPIVKEVKAWWGMKQEVTWNRHTQVLLSVTLLGFVLLVVPWHNRVTMPAVLQSGNQMGIYAPIPARIAQVPVANGSLVQPGESLFVLESPALAFQMAQAEAQLRQWEEELKRQVSVSAMADQAVITQQELSKSLANYLGIQQQMQRLNITAAFGGTIRDMAVGIEPGRWLDEHTRLALLAESATVVEGYVGEEDLERLHLGQQGYFLSDNPELPMVAAVVTQVDLGGVRVLSQVALASLYGGPIAVDRNDRGELVPRQAVYRIRFKVPAAGVPGQSWRGVAVVRGDARSIVGKLWQRVVGVFIRESGF